MFSEPQLSNPIYVSKKAELPRSTIFFPLYRDGFFVVPGRHGPNESCHLSVFTHQSSRFGCSLSGGSYFSSINKRKSTIFSGFVFCFLIFFNSRSFSVFCLFLFLFYVFLFCHEFMLATCLDCGVFRALSCFRALSAL